MPPFFHKKTIVTQETLGERFKKVRLGKGWNLIEAAVYTKINKKYLEALEGSFYDRIPGTVYIRNFIRSYSKYLGLDPARSLEKYKSEQHVIEDKQYHHFLKEIGGTPFLERLLKPNAVKTAGVCLIVFLVLSYIILNVYETIAPPYLVMYYPSGDITINELEISVFGKSEPEASVMINNNEITLNQGGEFKEEVTLRPGLNLIVISARRKHGLTRKVVRHVLVSKMQNAKIKLLNGYIAKLLNCYTDKTKISSVWQFSNLAI